jgi:hypothetical protein
MDPHHAPIHTLPGYLSHVATPATEEFNPQHIQASSSLEKSTDANHYKGIAGGGSRP